MPTNEEEVLTKKQIKELAAVLLAGPALQMAKMAGLDLGACFLELAEAALEEARRCAGNARRG